MLSGLFSMTPGALSRCPLFGQATKNKIKFLIFFLKTFLRPKLIGAIHKKLK
jgi:hypothetical protein